MMTSQRHSKLIFSINNTYCLACPDQSINFLWHFVSSLNLNWEIGTHIFWRKCVGIMQAKCLQIPKLLVFRRTLNSVSWKFLYLFIIKGWLKVYLLEETTSDSNHSLLILLSCNLTHKSLELKTIPVKLNVVNFVVTVKILEILKFGELR